MREARHQKRGDEEPVRHGRPEPQIHLGDSPPLHAASPRMC